MHRKIHWQVAALCLIQAILIITAVAGAILMRMDWALAACIGLLGMIALRDCIRGLDGRGIWVAAGLTVLMWGFCLANLDGIYDHKP